MVERLDYEVLIDVVVGENALVVLEAVVLIDEQHLAVKDIDRAVRNVAPGLEAGGLATTTEDLRLQRLAGHPGPLLFHCALLLGANGFDHAQGDPGLTEDAFGGRIDTAYIEKLRIAGDIAAWHLTCTASEGRPS